MLHVVKLSKELHVVLWVVGYKWLYDDINRPVQNCVQS